MSVNVLNVEIPTVDILRDSTSLHRKVFSTTWNIPRTSIYSYFAAEFLCKREKMVVEKPIYWYLWRPPINGLPGIKIIVFSALYDAWEVTDTQVINRNRNYWIDIMTTSTTLWGWVFLWNRNLVLNHNVYVAVVGKKLMFHYKI